MGKIETYKNKYGIKIVKCCASCIHHNADTEKTRICDAGYGSVKPSFLCGDCYQMIKKYENAGKGGGLVKKPHYVNWLLNYEQPTNGLNASIEYKIAEYESKYGSRYMGDNLKSVLKG